MELNNYTGARDSDTFVLVTKKKNCYVSETEKYREIFIF